MKLQRRELKARMQGEDVQRLQQELRQLGFDMLEDEVARRFFGTGTARAIRAFQEQHRLERTGVVDAATAEAISAAMAEAIGGDGGARQTTGSDGGRLRPEPRDEFMVRGTVRTAEGRPAAEVRVRAFDKDMRGEPQPLGKGEAVTNAYGRYEITYARSQFRRAEKMTADLIVHALGHDGTLLAESPLKYNAGPDQQIDLTLRPGPRRSEYEELLANLAPAMMGVLPADLTDDDITFLAGESGAPRDRIGFVRQSARLARETDVRAEVFYGFARQGLPIDDMRSLLRHRMPELRRALERAIADHIIPEGITSNLDSIMEHLRALTVAQALREPDESGQFNAGALLAGTRLSRPAQERLITLAAEHEGDSQEFWTRLAGMPEFRDRRLIEEVRLTLQLGALTGYHIPLLRALQALQPGSRLPRPQAIGSDMQLHTLQDLARLDEEHDWLALVREIGVPEGVPGDDDEARAKVYAAALHRQIEDAFPTPAFAAQIKRSNLAHRDALATFFATHPHFDLLSDSVDRTAGTRLDEPARGELKHVQRLARVVPRFRAVKTLMDAGIGSAQQIAAMTPGAFKARYGSALGGKQAARDVHVSAVRRSAMAMHLRLRYGPEQSRVRPVVIPPGLPEGPIVSEAPERPLDLRALFGSQDACACDHCNSVLSPSAYLVDLLQFIKNEADRGLAWLFSPGRRPDIEQLLLNCDNSNTPLPYVDLVNEILEQAVAQKSVVFWPQTTWKSEELAANPEHVTLDAYKALKQAVFPWVLPLDLAAVEARTYLKHLGTSRHELMELFYQGSQAEARQELTIAAEYLGLTETEWQIIAGQAAVIAESPWELWGLMQSENPVKELGTMLSLHWLEVLSRPRQVMERAGITFEELQRLLLTRFVNWFGDIALTFDDCSLDKARIVYTHADDPTRLCRFVRLWRALGWSIHELDSALQVFASRGGFGEVRLLSLSHLQRLHERLNIPLLQLLSFYADLDQLRPDRDDLYAPYDAEVEPTLFETVFFSKLVAHLEDADEQAFVNALDLGDGSSADLITSYLPQVTAGLGASAADVTLLLQTPADTYGAAPDQGVIRLSKPNLSRLYRIIRLCRVARLKISEFIALVGLTGIDPLVAGPTDQYVAVTRTMAFLQALDHVRSSKFSIYELDWLLRHRASPQLTEASLRQNAVTLQQLRAGLQQIAADTTLPSDIAPGEIEALLRQKLSLLLTPEDVDLLFRWIRSEYKFSFLLADNFVSEHPTLAFLNLRMPFPGLPSESETVRRERILLDRYTNILKPLLPVLRDLLSCTLIKQQTAQALQLDPALTEKLLEEWVADDAGNNCAIHAFLDSAFAESKAPDTLVRKEYSDQQAVAYQAEFRSVFLTLERLRKVALMLSRLGIGFAEARDIFAAKDKGWLDLAKLPITRPTAEADDQSLYKGWRRLVDVCALHRRLGPAEPTLFDLFDLAGGTSDAPVDALYRGAEPFKTALLARTGWSNSDVEELLKWFNYSTDDSADDFRDEQALVRMEACLQLSRRLGVSIGQPWNLIDWAKCQSDIPLEVASSIKRATRARYADDEAWAAVARPLQDALREVKRNALLAYLITYAHDQSGSPVWQDANDVYAHFLIDVEMSPCMLTSRTKQAISSVQLFIQRIFMRLEENVEFLDREDAAAQWAWMKNYRVWEANRKVFLFPENWIEPELRDDKSPFFKELENELRQNEITPEYVEKAYFSYLEKLETVSNLEIVGQYYDEVRCLLHVFGRTNSKSPRYYYRYLDDFYGQWSPWEAINVDIEGDQLLPVVWNRRLYLFWPIFKEEQDKQSRPTGEQEAKRYWTIQMAWTERWPSDWTPTKATNVKMTPHWTTPKQVTRIVMIPKRRKLVDQGMEPIYVDINGTNKRYFVFRANIDPSSNLTICCWYVRTDRDYDHEEITMQIGRDKWMGIELYPGDESKADLNNKSDLAMLELASYWGTDWSNGICSHATELRKKIGWVSLWWTNILSDSDDTTQLLAAAAFIEQHRAVVLNAWPKIKDLLQEYDPTHTNIPKDHTMLSSIEKGMDAFVVHLTSPEFDDLIDALRSFRVLKETKNDFIFHASGQVEIPEPYAIDDVDTLNVFHPAAKFENMTLCFRPGASNVSFRAAIPRELWGADRFGLQSSITFWGDAPDGFRLHFLHQDPVVWWWPLVYQASDSSLIVWPSVLKGDHTWHEWELLFLRYMQPREMFKYHVRRLYHPYIWLFKQELNKAGIDGLLRQPESPTFSSTPPDGLYRQRTHEPWKCKDPDQHIVDLYPDKVISFDPDDAYSLYNWELFFHIPLLIAERLSQNQQFEAAMLWFHYIFDVLTPDPNDLFDWQRPWKLGPFWANGDATRSIEELMTLLSKEGTEETSEAQQTPAAEHRKSLEHQIDKWRHDPFKPHLLARLRITPYMKSVVMKYLDNLIDWADQLFRRDTIESINEATQLYILAAEILGRRPQQLPPCEHQDRSYAELKDHLDAFSDILEDEIPEHKAASPFAVASLTLSLVPAAPGLPLAPLQLLLPGGADGQAGDGKEYVRVAGYREAGDRLERGRAKEVIGGPPKITDPLTASPRGRYRQGDTVAGQEIVGPITGRPESQLGTAPVITLPPPGLYFCIPQNDVLLSYWDTVADRLFKIRHCMNIEGVVRELALYEPPIDPRLLVRAVAAGVDFSTVLNELSAPAPHYRFTVVVQRAAELCQEVKSLGAALLASLEKRDAEGLALLRSEHEVALLKAVREVRKQQRAEAESTLEGLRKAQAIAAKRESFYTERLAKGLLEEEQQSLVSQQQALERDASASREYNLAASLGKVLNVTISTNFKEGPTFSKQTDGYYDAFGSMGHAGELRATAGSLRSDANLKDTRGRHKRTFEEWRHQAAVAKMEGQQIEKQIAAAEVRVAIAENELANHEQQIENAQAVDAYMRSKFTNEDLYDWMIGQIAVVYFQSYQLAYDTTKRAEQAYRFELGLPDSDNARFISFGYWDSLRKGLLSGEQLYHDLKRLEVDYLERNRREYEITKHISLALIDPVALLNLRQTGECFVDLPEQLFNLDCPGHYMRRIKSVGVTIPCVAGPYTSVNCTLTLLSSKVRTKSTVNGGYDDESNYTPYRGALQSIVTSSGQNDSGLFELNFRDERYLPFEGAGAISSWRIELPREFRQFDYDTITDVILHVRYTAREGGNILRDAATRSIKEGGPGMALAKANQLQALLTGGDPGLFHLLSAKHDFPTEWYRFVSGTELSMMITKELFPYQFSQNPDVTGVNIEGIGLLLVAKQPVTQTTVQFTVTPGGRVDLTALDSKEQREFAGKVSVDQTLPMTLVISGATPPETEDLLMVFRYSVGSQPG